MQLVTGQDHIVADWLAKTVMATPLAYKMAVGITEDGSTLCGGFMFTNYNGSEAEVHFYGPGKLKGRVFRSIFFIAAQQFNLNRLVVRTRKTSMARGVLKLGAHYEGMHRRVYGPTDGNEHAARQFVFYRERIRELAGLERKTDVRK